MHTCKITIKSLTPYSPSRKHDTPKISGESPDAYEQRTWRNKAHVNEDGKIIIPPMNFKYAIEAAAKHKGERIKGKGMKTWAGKITPGILIADPLVLDIDKDSVRGETFQCHADGKKTSGTRVPRTFPMVDS
jgi:hypothetical protein